jgi:hypothetical protein
MKRALILSAPLLALVIFMSCQKFFQVLRKDIQPQHGALLRADGPGGTYELIDSVLGGSAEEVPDCSHPAFGRHIGEIWDSTLHCYVFAFYIHVTPDNDRCVNFDRQRNEIKTYGPSPDSLKGFLGDTMTQEWKFKLDSGFQPSPSFTHIHQIKAGDGDAGAPLITLTPRFGHPDKMQVIHTGSSSATSLGTVVSVSLAPFMGTWVKAEEHIIYKTAGSYSLTIRRMSDDSVLLSYSNTNIDMWRDSTTFCRPKWGIYRSLNNKSYLRDEIVRFNDFYIVKGAN